MYSCESTDTFIALSENTKLIYFTQNSKQKSLFKSSEVGQ